MIIIWGHRGRTSHLDSGRFYCPRCDGERYYDLKQVRPWFTLYFIPVFPTGAGERYVECQTCGGTFKEAVLEMEAPGEGERILSRVLDDLHDGMSLEDAERVLADAGLERPRARRIVEEMAGEDTWACAACGRHYLAEVRRCRACRE